MWNQNKFVLPVPSTGLFPHASLFLLLFFNASLSVPAAPNDMLTTPGLVREFNAPIEEVRQAVSAVVRDQIIHGTLMFDKEPTLNGAEAVSSTPLFDPWTGTGEVYYKIRRNAIAPRHFKDSGDQGTIAVRYVVISVDGYRTRVKVDAVYVETAHRVAHESDGTVEKTELKEIKEHLDALEEQAAEAADARRRATSAELVKQSFLRQRDDESTRLSNAQASEKDLEQQVKALHQDLERRIKAPGATLKAAPFRSAAAVQELPANANVLILIVTPHWLGVETPEGQRGWLPEQFLEQLP
jgi:hypothetical protein